MKRLLILIVVFIMPCYLKAQDFLLGESKEKIRESFKDSPFLIKQSQSDTCDTFIIPGDIQLFYRYKDGICYTTRTTFPLSYFDALQIPLSHYKKVKENIWTNEGGTEKIELLVVKDKSQCVLEVSPLDRTNKN